MASASHRWPVIIYDDPSEHESIADSWEEDAEFAECRRRGDPAMGMPHLKYVADSPTEALTLAEHLTFAEVLGASADESWLAELVKEPASEPGEPYFADMSVEQDEPWSDLALVTTDAAWKVPAYLPRGGGNDVPARAQIAAFIRHYEERYHPVLYRVQYEVEMVVSRRPQTAREARDLATDHILFCSELLDREGMTFDRYAQHLMESNLWSFCWD